jgi:hypothetical protein
MKPSEYGWWCDEITIGDPHQDIVFCDQGGYFSFWGQSAHMRDRMSKQVTRYMRRYGYSGYEITRYSVGGRHA